MNTELVEAAAAGDKAALGALIDEFMPTVLATAYGCCGDWHQVGDIAQEAFAVMVSRLGDLREPAAFPGWMVAITRSCARRERRRVQPLPPASPAPGPEELVIEREEAGRVRAAVEQLPPEQRLPMVLHYFAGHRLAEIADLCDLPLSTVKQRMRLARARLKETVPTMSDSIADDIRSPEPDAASDVIRMYTAMRSGDLDRVAAILDKHPELVNAREHWTRAESFAHRLPVGLLGGTPLLRAIERGDADMVQLLIERGADVNGACTCDGGEQPLWVAVAQREDAIVDILLEHGADPNATAFNDVSPLDVARLRGYTGTAEKLEAAGAVSSKPAPFERTGVTTARATGIKAIDLWAPFPERGLVHLTPGFGLGAVVLISELSYRAARTGQPVVWTGFVQAPTDLGDIHHALAESAIIDDVMLLMAPPTAPLDTQVAALDAGIELAGDSAFLVVFGETGRMHAIEERLLRLSQRDAVTLIVAPLDGSVAPPKPEGSPTARRSCSTSTAPCAGGGRRSARRRGARSRHPKSPSSPRALATPRVTRSTST